MPRNEPDEALLAPPSRSRMRPASPRSRSPMKRWAKGKGGNRRAA